MALEYFAIGSSNTIELVGLRDDNDNLIGATAVVTGTLMRGQNALADGTVQFTYISAGRFRGVLNSAAPMLSGRSYRLLVAIAYEGKQFALSLVRQAQYVEI